MKHYPIIFGLRDVVQGEGYIAGVAVDGRALMHEEADGYVWVEGVNPGGFSGTGNGHAEALEEFRKAYRAALYDIALDATDFGEFKKAVEAFFSNAGAIPRQDWEEAVHEVRAGRIAADWLGKRPADTPIKIEVVQLEKPSARKNEVEEGSALAA